ncbi:MAG: T9SS type A sorting domain-containing protein [Bacteroidota bacterium]
MRTIIRNSILLGLRCVIMLSPSLLAQTVYHLPFASSGNTIELVVANASSVGTTGVTVSVQNAPSWLQFTQKEQTISSLAAGEERLATFVFTVNKSSPVNKPEQVTFTISNSNGETWTKTLSLQVSPPEKFELFQNYPNPFNPTTVISYQLPVASNITLKIFDAIGREVVTLDEGMKEAGYHQKEWNATNASSGMYIYQLAWKNEKGEQKFYRKKLMVMK